MRKYLKPALEIEAFDVEDVLTVSTFTPNVVPDPPQGERYASAPIDMIELN